MSGRRRHPGAMPARLPAGGLWPLVGGLAVLVGLSLLAGCGGTLDFDAARQEGSAAMFVASFLGGMAVCFTPCVYPLIPITVSVFGGVPGDDLPPRRRRLRAITTGTTYVLGIALTYSSLGLLAGLAGKQAVGDHLGAWYVVVPMALLFAALATSMFGAFEIRLPVSWQTRLSAMGGSGLLGGLLMGLVAGLIAAPCTGPVITGILLFIASSRDAFTGFWLLFTFSLGLGLMFMVIAAFASVMPRSGRWMEGVKSFFGILLLVAALYYLSALLPPLSHLRQRATWILGTGLGLTVIGAAIGGVHLSFHGARPLTLLRKSAGVLALTAGLFMTLQYARGSTVELQYTSIPEAQQAARKTGKPMLMDFWATWCEKCIELEKETLADPRVEKLLGSRFITVKVDCSKNSQQTKATKARWKVKDLPTLVLVNSQGERVKNIVGKVGPAELLQELRQIE